MLTKHTPALSAGEMKSRNNNSGWLQKGQPKQGGGAFFDRARTHLRPQSVLIAGLITIAAVGAIFIFRSWRVSNLKAAETAEFEQEPITEIEFNGRLSNELDQKVLSVAEKIQFTSAHRVIRRGMSLFLWKKYLPESKDALPENYAFESALVDGASAAVNDPTEFKDLLLFDFGDKNSDVATGPHTYEVKYTTTPLPLRQADRHEILQYPVTGPTILLTKKVRATFVLPSYVSEVLSRSAWIATWSGNEGANPSARLPTIVAVSSTPKAGSELASVTVETTEPLLPSQFLTVRLEW